MNVFSFNEYILQYEQDVIQCGLCRINKGKLFDLSLSGVLSVSVTRIHEFELAVTGRVN